MKDSPTTRRSSQVLILSGLCFGNSTGTNHGVGVWRPAPFSCVILARVRAQPRPHIPACGHLGWRRPKALCSSSSAGVQSGLWGPAMARGKGSTELFCALISIPVSGNSRSCLNGHDIKRLDSPQSDVCTQ